MANTIIKLLKETVSSYPEAIATLSKDSEGEFVPTSYNQLYELVNAWGAGLIAYGVKRGDHLGLISENRKEWLISDLAILGIGAVDVPRGSDSTADELKYILKHADCSITMVEDSVQLKKVLGVKKALPLLKTIVVLDEKFRKKEDRKDGVKIFTFQEIMDMGNEKIAKDPDFAEREFKLGEGDDLATIIYTSGTTGEPKGVMLSHRNFLYQIEKLPEILAITANDIWLAVLPVWHSFERIMQYVALGTASALAYSKPVGSIMLGDMAALHPTWMASVPRIWEAVRSGIYRKINSEGGIKKKLFYFFVAVGAAHAALLNRFRGLLPQFRKSVRWLDITISIIPLILLTPLNLLGALLVFSKIKKKLGGKFVAGISGGGALPPQVDKFYSAIGVLIIEAYGLTETAPAIAARIQIAPVPSTVGPPLSGTEIRVLDEHNNVLPPGEMGVLYVRGEQVMSGYYHNPEETAKVLSEDGWLNTGDLVMLTHNNEIAITGRAKDTIVLLGGENIEPEPIEQAIRQSAYVDQVIVVGQDQKFLAALVIPSLENLEQYATSFNIPYLAKEDLVDTPEITELLEEEIESVVNIRKGFKRFERIFRFKVLGNPFEVGRELTHTLKMRRNVISGIYKKEIEELFR